MAGQLREVWTPPLVTKILAMTDERWRSFVRKSPLDSKLNRLEPDPDATDVWENEHLTWKLAQQPARVRQRELLEQSVGRWREERDDYERHREADPFSDETKASHERLHKRRRRVTELMRDLRQALYLDVTREVAGTVVVPTRYQIDRQLRRGVFVHVSVLLQTDQKRLLRIFHVTPPRMRALLAYAADVQRLHALRLQLTQEGRGP